VYAFLTNDVRKLELYWMACAGWSRNWRTHRARGRRGDDARISSCCTGVSLCWWSVYWSQL